MYTLPVNESGEPSVTAAQDEAWRLMDLDFFDVAESWAKKVISDLVVSDDADPSAAIFDAVLFCAAVDSVRATERRMQSDLFSNGCVPGFEIDIEFKVGPAPRKRTCVGKKNRAGSAASSSEITS